MKTRALGISNSAVKAARKAFALFWCAAAVLMLVAVTGVPAGAAIDIPLSVHEALRGKVSGIDRVSEPVTVGVPFPKGSLREKGGVPQLAVKGAPAYQFRTLARWEDGSVRWALADFQADVRAKGWNRELSIVPGTGSTAGDMASEQGGVITVDTGVIAVKIKKKGFNLFDSVAAGQEVIVEPGASAGIVVAGGDGTEYLASADPFAMVSIEENGPVRVVVKAEGTHMAAGKRMMDFTVRMHFYRRSSRVKVFYTLRNASRRQMEHTHIRSLDLVTRIAAPGEAIAAGHDGEVKRRLTKESGGLVYYQAVSDFPQSYGWDAFYEKSPIPPDYKKKGRGFTQEGYWIKQGGKELASGGRGEYPELAYLDASSISGAGATVGVRYAAALWPKSLSVAPDGNVSVGLWPKEKEGGYWIRFASHNTFEVMYDFHGRRNDPEHSMKRFQYPLAAKAPVEWYNESAEGLYPLYNFVSFKDERRFAEDNGWDYSKQAAGRDQPLRIFRYFYWGWGGFANQHDFARINIVNFLRDTENAYRAGEYFLYSEARFNYNADWAIYHSDDYRCTDCTKRGWGPRENRSKTIQNGVTYDYEHPHWYGLPLYYYMTGDERIKESIIDFADILKEWQDKNWIFVDPRHFGWELYSLAAMYDFTGDPEYMKLADNLFARFLEKKHNPAKPFATVFIDWDRGFVAGGSGSGWKEQAGLKPGLMTGYAIYDGIANYYLHMDDKNPLRERAADVMEGISEFMLREPYFEGEVRGRKITWLPYIYNLEDRSRSMHEYKTLRQAFYVNLIPYHLNGDDRWLERMDKLIMTAASSSPDHLDYPGLQAMIQTRMKSAKKKEAPPAVSDLAAAARGDEALLSWKAPEGAARYQVKYSRKKLVESLAFDPDERTYEYDPEEHANWWAGENVPEEPAPGAKGEPQKLVVKGLKPGRYYFAVRSWDSSNNRSRISNLAEVEIR